MTIRAALDAAALAVMTDAERHYADAYHGGQPGAGARHRAAAAIAAFLRHRAASRPALAAMMHQYAADVEDAARDG